MVIFETNATVSQSYSNCSMLCIELGFTTRNKILFPGKFQIVVKYCSLCTALIGATHGEDSRYPTKSIRSWIVASILLYYCINRFVTP